MGGIRNVCKIIVEELDGSKSLKRPRSRCGVNTVMYLKEVKYEDVH
jgi:hypothetical protein